MIPLMYDANTWDEKDNVISFGFDFRATFGTILEYYGNLYSEYKFAGYRVEMKFTHSNVLTAVGLKAVPSVTSAIDNWYGTPVTVWDATDIKGDCTARTHVLNGETSIDKRWIGPEVLTTNEFFSDGKGLDVKRAAMGWAPIYAMSLNPNSYKLICPRIYYTLNDRASGDPVLFSPSVYCYFHFRGPTGTIVGVRADSKGNTETVVLMGGASHRGYNRGNMISTMRAHTAYDEKNAEFVNHSNDQWDGDEELDEYHENDPPATQPPARSQPHRAPAHAPSSVAQLSALARTAITMR